MDKVANLVTYLTNLKASATNGSALRVDGVWKVPDVLLSGHEKNIEKWHMEQSITCTKERRPKLLDE